MEIAGRSVWKGAVVVGMDCEWAEADTPEVEPLFMLAVPPLMEAMLLLVAGMLLGMEAWCNVGAALLFVEAVLPLIRVLRPFSAAALGSCCYLPRQYCHVSRHCYYVWRKCCHLWRGGSADVYGGCAQVVQLALGGQAWYTLNPNTTPQQSQNSVDQKCGFLGLISQFRSRRDCFSLAGTDVPEFYSPLGTDRRLFCDQGH